MRKFNLIVMLACFSVLDVCSQNRVPAFEMNARLGRGVNMGNAFEAPSETEWGNPWQPEYFKIISGLGFDHVRLPVRWEPTDRSSTMPPYTVNPVFLDRIKEVIDTALKYKLHIIVNMHHHEALYSDPQGQKARFLSQWGQIATHFKDYPDSLLFEVLNEPHGNLTPNLWNQYFAEALVEIRKTNPTRVVLMGVADYGGLGGIVNLSLPADEYIILSPHYYNPFSFTHQGAEWVGPQADEWLGTTWNDTEADRETVASEFSYALQFSQTQHIPIHVGEFGAYSKADIESRAKWSTFLARWFEEQSISWAYWEFSAGFGIYSPTTGQTLGPLVDALLHQEMPEPVQVTTTQVYASNFSNGLDGWTLQTNSAASASASANEGKLTVAITNGGTEGWHVQLVKGGIPLQQYGMYRVSFRAKASADRSATVYIGRNSNPWNSYSGYTGVTINTAETNYSFSFVMSSPTDLAARLVFDLGTNTNGATITSVKVEKLELPITATSDNRLEAEVICFPNPVDADLHVLIMANASSHTTAELYDMAGRLMTWHASEQSHFTLPMANFSGGLYLLRLTGNGREKWMKIIKGW